MANKKNLKRTVIASVIAMFLSLSLLLGTTFAWFTDSVTNTNNIIKSGNVDVELLHASNDSGKYEQVNGSTKLFLNAEKGEIIWEPGASAKENFQIKNLGSLAFKYELRIKAIKTTTADNKSLADVLTLTVKEGDALLVEDFFNAGYTIKDKQLKAGEIAEFSVEISWKNPQLDYNDYQDLSLRLGVELVATQLNYESDGKGNGFDQNASFPNVSGSVSIPTTDVSENIIIAPDTQNPIKVEIPAQIINNLPEEITSLSIVYTDPVIDQENESVIIETIELVDQYGNVINLEELGLNKKVSVTLPKQELFENGTAVQILHDGKSVASAIVNEDGTITYDVAHFCKIEIEEATLVSTADDLVRALEAGKDVLFANDIKIDPANMSNAYGTTGINVKNGQTIDGNGYTLDVKGAGGTWDSGINTTGGIIRNIKVTGSFRGIFINHNSAIQSKVILDNVTIEGTTYTISCDQGTNNGLEAINCTFNGWTSYAKTLGEVKFVNCSFGEGNGYAYCRPYASTEFVGCTFAEGYKIDTRATTTFENCTFAGEKLTADSLSSLVASNANNASVK